MQREEKGRGRGVIIGPRGVSHSGRAARTGMLATQANFHQVYVQFALIILCSFKLLACTQCLITVSNVSVD